MPGISTYLFQAVKITTSAFQIDCGRYWQKELSIQYFALYLQPGKILTW